MTFSVVVGLAGVVERTERFRTFAAARRCFHGEAYPLRQRDRATSARRLLYLHV